MARLGRPGMSDERKNELWERWHAGESMLDRSSAPATVPGRTPPETEALIGQLRRLRWTSTRIDRPGHRVTGTRTDRNRGAGWEAVHVAVDDTTRPAYVEILPDERGATSVGFLQRAIAWFADHGVTVERVMTDNGAPYVSRAWAAWCADHDLRHLRTRPYRPRTNGKAERFIQTMLREWAYAAAYLSSAHRADVLPTWLEYYNHRRPHSALGHKPPATRLTNAD